MSALAAAPTFAHLAATVGERLRARGFEEIAENGEWGSATSRFFFTGCEGALIAVNWVSKDRAVIIGADCSANGVRCSDGECEDSVYRRAVADVRGNNGVCSWIDRDLRVAGTVVFRDRERRLRKALVETAEPVAFIPGLSVNIANSKMKPFVRYKKEDFYPFMGFNGDENEQCANVLMGVLAKECNCEISDVVDFEVYFVPSQKPRLIGVDKKLLSSPKINNFGTAITALLAFESVEKVENGMCVLVLFDDESGGSESQLFTKTDFLSRFFQKMNVDDGFYQESIFASVNCFYGYNPNFSAKFNQEFKALIGEGPVISNVLSYISSQSMIIREIQESKNLKLQIKTSQCFSSAFIQNLITKLGLKSFEVGIPVLGMDSIIETCSIDDLFALSEFLHSYIKKCCK